MGTGAEENQRRDETHSAPRTEAARRRMEEPLGRVGSFERIGTFVVVAEDNAGYEQPCVHLNGCAARTAQLIPILGTAHGDAVQPKLSVVVRRFLFHSHVRRPGQSILQFAAELKQLSDHCGFGSALDDMLRDRLLCGLEDEVVQRRLLDEQTPLNFNRALHISLDMEAAGHVNDLQNGHELRTAATQHVDRDAVVKDKVPHEQSWNPGLDQEDPEPASIKEEKKALSITMEGGRPHCLMQEIPVLENLADFKQLWAAKGHVRPEHNDPRPGLDQENSDRPGTEEEPESLYTIKAGEQHQILIQVLECPAHIQQLWAVKEDHPPVLKGLQTGLDQNQVDPDPVLTEEEQEESCVSQGQKDPAINGGGPDPWDPEDFGGPDPWDPEDFGGPDPWDPEDYGGLDPWDPEDFGEPEPSNPEDCGRPDSPDIEECGGPEPNMNPDHRMYLRRAAPNSGHNFSKSKKRKVTTNSSLEKHKETTTGGHFDLFVKDTSTCHRLGLRDGKNAISFRDVSGRNKLCCIDCGKRFRYYSWLKRHMTVHKCEKSNTSAMCAKKASYTHHLRTHTEHHKVDKPFSDSVGEKSLSPKINLSKIMINHIRERKFVCSVCDQIFLSRIELNDHRRIHTGEKPYGCPLCGLRYYAKSSVNRHMLVHK